MNERDHDPLRFYEELGYSAIRRLPANAGGRPFPRYTRETFDSVRARWNGRVGIHGSADLEAEHGSATAGSDIVVPLHPYFRDLRVVHAQVGDDTLTLLFDTGGGATLITPQVAHYRGCIPHGADIGHRMTGEPVTFARCDSLRLSLGSWTGGVGPVAVLDVNALLPSELPRLDGVLALDVFRGQVLTIDWPAGTLFVRDSASEDSAVASTGIAVRFATGESGRSFTAADLILDGAIGTDYLLRGPVTLDLRHVPR